MKGSQITNISYWHEQQCGLLFNGGDHGIYAVIHDTA